VLFLFRSSKLVVDCFTPSAQAYEYSKPDFAKRFIPSWWKEVPKQYVSPNDFFPKPTVKTCSGIIELYKNGIMLPLWSELAVEVGQIGTTPYQWRFASAESTAEAHPPIEHNNSFPMDQYAHLKLHSPWRLRTKNDVNWVWMQPSYGLKSLTDYVVLPGIVNYKYSHATNVNLFFMRHSVKRTVLLDCGSPIAHLVPMSDKKIDLRHHLIDEKEFYKLEMPRRHFINSYEHNKKAKKCPF